MPAPVGWDDLVVLNLEESNVGVAMFGEIQGRILYDDFTKRAPVCHQLRRGRFRTITKNQSAR